MRAYIAAPYAARSQARRYAKSLERLDITVTSTWLKESTEINAGTTGAAVALSDDAVAQHAYCDLADIDSSDVLILLTESVAALEAGGSATTGGRHIETGYAIAHGKRVIVVGQAENVFHRAADLVTRVPDWQGALEVLLSIRRCRSCGCVDERACPGGCSWATSDLCSRCAEVLEVPRTLGEQRDRAPLSVETLGGDEVTC